MSEKLVLIDGHSILNRAFFGIPDLTNSEGLHTNAVYGFLNILFKILEEEQPNYLTVAFDVSQPTFRHKMYAEYKGTRKPMAEELREQVPLMKEMLKAKGVNILVDEGVLYKKRGIGMFVSAGAKEAILSRRKNEFYDNYVKKLLEEAASIGLGKEEVIQLIQSGNEE